MSNAPPRKKLKQAKITSMFRRIDSQRNGEEYEMMECDNTEVQASNSSRKSPEAEEFKVLDAWSEEESKKDESQSEGEELKRKENINLHLKNFAQDFRKKLQVPSKADSQSVLSEKRKFKKRKSSPNRPKLDVPPQPSDEVISWKGSPISSFVTLSKENENIAEIKFSADHTVLVKLPLHEMLLPEPFPTVPVDLWDGSHVRMPNSSHSLYPAQDGSEEITQRWSVICNTFKEPITNMDQFTEAVTSYNQRYKDQWKFQGLGRLLEQEFDEEESNHFFDHILPGIIKLALSLPTVITQSIPLLSRDKSHSITMSQKQISCLLANAFLCTFPRRNAKGQHTEFRFYPDINFNRFLMHTKPHSLEKIKCVLHYFKEVLSKEPDGLITFTRQCIDIRSLEPYECSASRLPRFYIDTHGFIEEQDGLLQMDFANRFLGGGVLGLGCVQEEIRFVLCPELLVTRLFTESLSKNEAVFVTGVERFNKGSGYSTTFKWEGPHYDVTPRDQYKRRICQIVCLNARSYMRDAKLQYRTDDIMGEFHKAAVGFKPVGDCKGPPAAVATGNWGCGAFRGDAILKGLIQYGASGLNKRDIAYFTFGDKKIRDTLAGVFEDLRTKGITVGELVMCLCQYGESTGGKSSLIEYINRNLLNSGETDQGTQMEDDQPSTSIDSKKVSESISRFFNSTITPTETPPSKDKEVCSEEKIQAALDSPMEDEPMSIEPLSKPSTVGTQKASLLAGLDQIDQTL